VLGVYYGTKNSSSSSASGSSTEEVSTRDATWNNFDGTCATITASRVDRLVRTDSFYSCDSIKTSNDYFRLFLCNDGNMKIFGRNQFDSSSSWSEIWESNSGGGTNGPYRATMQGDSNFVIYDRDGHPIWASNTCCHNYLYSEVFLSPYGNLLVQEEAPWQTTVLWQTNTDKNCHDYASGDAFQFNHDDTLLLEWTDGNQWSRKGNLNQCEGLKSSNGHYIAVQQSDGNFVVYNTVSRSATFSAFDKNLVMGSRDNMQSPFTLTMGQYRGDWYTFYYMYHWYIETTGPSSNEMRFDWCSGLHQNCDHLKMQDDGNLVLYDNGQPCWCTWSGCLV